MNNYTFSDYTPHDNALTFHKSDAHAVLIVSSIRAGKSYSLIHDAIKAAWNNKTEFGVLVAAPSFRLLQAVLEAPMVEKIEKYGLLGSHSFAKHETILKNGNKIYYRTLENPDVSLRGLNICEAYVDEAAYCSEYALKVVKGRLLTTGGRLVQATTPNGITNHIYDYFIKNKDNADVKIIRYEMTDNPIITQDAVDRYLSELDPLTARQEVYGEFVALYQDRVYYSFNDENIGEYKLNPHHPVYVGVDWNIGINATVAMQKVGDDIFILSAKQGLKMPQDVAEYIKSMYGTMPFIIPDATGKVEKQILNQAGLYNIASRKANPRRVQRYSVANAGFLNGLGDRHIFIDKNCKELIHEFKTISFKKDSDKPETMGDKIGHLTDAATYPIFHLFGGQASFSTPSLNRFEQMKKQGLLKKAN